MNRIFIILGILLIAGCTEHSKRSTPPKTYTPSKISEHAKISTPPEMIRNDKCVDIEGFKIFQVIDNGALARACDTEYCFGHTVFIPNIKGEEYWDNKIITAPAGKCIIYEGVFKYTSNDGRNRTVPKLKIVDSQIPNPAYGEWLKKQNSESK